MKFSENKTIALLFAAALVLRLGFVLATPAWQSPDEYPHYWVVHKIAAEHRLPASSPVFPAYEAFQPPLYYVVAGALLSPFHTGALRFTPEPAPPPGLLLLMRLLSVAAGLLTLYFSFRMMQRLTGPTPADRIAGIAFLSFLPTFAGLTATVNNDAFTVLLASVSLFVLVRPAVDARTAFCSGLWAGAALLTKLSALILLPVILFHLYQRQRAARPRQPRLYLAAGAGWAAGALLLTARNVLQYGSVLALNPGVGRAIDVSPGHLVWALRNLNWSFWLAFGRTYQITLPPAVYLFTVLPLLAAAGFGWLRLRRTHRDLLHLLLFAILGASVLSLGYTLLYPPGTMTSWGKNLYPVLPLAAVFFANGWNGVSRKISFAALVLMAAGCGWALLTLRHLLPPPLP